MGKRTFLSAFLLLAMAFGASAAPLIVPAAGGSQGIDIPERVMEIAGEKDLTEIFCYEAKWRGGEAVAAIEAVREAFAGPLSKLAQYGAEINIDEYLGDGTRLRAKMEAICSSPDIETAKLRIEEFRTLALSARTQMESRLKTALKSDIESALEAKKEEIKAQMRKELEEEADKMGQEVEKKLRAEAQAEVETLKIRLKAQIKSQVEAEIRSRYAGSDAAPDMGRLRAEGERLAATKGEAEKEKLRKEMEEKYQKRGEEERKKLEAQFEKVKEGKKKEMEALGEIFQDMQQRVKELIEEKFETEWSKYEGMAKEKKLGILKKIIDFYFDRGREAIEANRSLVERAKEQPGGNDIPSIEELLSNLESDRQEVYAIFEEGYTEGKEARVRKEFEEKWEAVRQQLEKAKITALGDLIAEIEKKADWNKLENELKQARKQIGLMLDNYAKNYDFCAEHEEIKRPENESRVDDCAKCYGLEKIAGRLGDSEALAGKLDKAIELIGKFEGYGQARPSLEEALNFKDELQSALTDLKQYEAGHKRIWNEYQEEYRLQKEICKSLIK